MTYDIISYTALHSQVLVVAIRRVEGSWSAYIAPCPGENHEREVQEVARHGNKMWEPLARFLFPGIPGPYAS